MKNIQWPTPTYHANLRRVHALDAIRGLAIILMIIDHVIYSRGWHLPIVRLTVTRASMPLFMLTAGYLWARKGPPSTIRMIQTGAAASIAALLTVLAKMVTPEILTLYCITMTAAPMVIQWPIAAAVIGIIQSYAWPLDHCSYQPGVIMAMCALGVMIHDTGYIPRFRNNTLEAVGRRPLELYLGHLTILSLWTVLT